MRNRSAPRGCAPVTHYALRVTHSSPRLAPSATAIRNPQSAIGNSPSLPYTAAMDETIRKNLRPGVRVKVTQQISARHYAWPSEVTGTVVQYEQKQTGSWYAHSKHDKLWLDRLLIRK